MYHSLIWRAYFTGINTEQTDSVAWFTVIAERVSTGPDNHMQVISICVS